MLQMGSFVLIVVTFTTIILPSNAIWTSSATKNHSLCALTVRRKSNKSHISSSISASFIRSNPVLLFNNFYSSIAYLCSNVSTIGIDINIVSETYSKNIICCNIWNKFIYKAKLIYL